MDNYSARKIELLKVAETLFSEKGFDGTSIRDIAKKAKINIAMISYYFGSKEKLLEAVILFRTSELKLELENVYQSKISPLEKIDHIIERYILQLNSNREIFRILYNQLLSNEKNIYLKKFTAIKKHNMTYLEKVIKEGQDQHIFQKKVNILLIYPTIVGSFFQFYINKSFYKEILNLETDSDYDHYINTDLTKHIKQTIKALLIYEN